MSSSDSASQADEESFSDSYDCEIPFGKEVRERPCPHLLTYVLIGTNVASFIAMLGLQEHPWSIMPPGQNMFLGPRTSVLVRFGGLSPGEVRHRHQWWRLLSGFFVHAGVLHLLLNMFVLKQLGSTLEAHHGHCKFGVLYVATGLFASMCAAIFSDAVTVGASGAIMGIFGGFWSMWLQQTCYRERWLCCRFGFFLLWNTVFIILTSLLPMVQAWAHFGGLFMGFLLGNALLIRPLGVKDRIRFRQCTLSTLSLIIAAVAFVAATVAISEDVDVFKLVPAARSINCFDTPFWRCCDFASVSCSWVKHAGEYWIGCTPTFNNSQREGMHGPYSNQPDRCACAKACGP